MPLNTYVIIVLLTLRYMNSFTVALIAGTMCFVSSAIGIYLVIYLIIYPEKKLVDKTNNNILPNEKQM